MSTLQARVSSYDGISVYKGRQQHKVTVEGMGDLEGLTVGTTASEPPPVGAVYTVIDVEERRSQATGVKLWKLTLAPGTTPERLWVLVFWPGLTQTREGIRVHNALRSFSPPPVQDPGLQAIDLVEDRIRRDLPAVIGEVLDQRGYPSRKRRWIR